MPYVRTDRDHRVLAVRGNPPPEGAPGNWYEVDGVLEAENDPGHRSVLFYTPQGGFVVTQEPLPQDDPSVMAIRIRDMENRLANTPTNTDLEELRSEVRSRP